VAGDAGAAGARFCNTPFYGGNSVGARSVTAGLLVGQDLIVEIEL